MAQMSLVFFFFKQNTAYEVRISDWISDCCSSDLRELRARSRRVAALFLSPSPWGEGLGWGIAPGAELSGEPPPPAPPLKGRGEVMSIAMNHWGVQRKMIFALERQLWG